MQFGNIKSPQFLLHAFSYLQITPPKVIPSIAYGNAWIAWALPNIPFNNSENFWAEPNLSVYFVFNRSRKKEELD